MVRIHFDARKILVRAEIAKTCHRRFPPIPSNLEAWLKLYLERTPSPGKGKVIKLTATQIDKARREIYAEVAPGKRWIDTKNGLRKSFASAMINSGKSRDKTCDALGHEGDTRKLYRYYQLAASEAEARAYWQIFPPAA